MSPKLKKAIAGYAEMEMEIGRLVAQRLFSVCADCTKQCCRPDVCRQAVESWWMRHVSEHVHGKWWPDDWETAERCIAMTESGCMLKAGRPVICRSFVCDQYTEAYRDIWEVIFYSFIADLPWEVGQISSRVHVETLEGKLMPKYAAKLAERIAAGREQLELAKGLLDEGRGETDKHVIAWKLLCLSPRFWRMTTRRAMLTRLGDERLAAQLEPAAPVPGARQKGRP